MSKEELLEKVQTLNDLLDQLASHGQADNEMLDQLESSITELVKLSSPRDRELYDFTMELIRLLLEHDKKFKQRITSEGGSTSFMEQYMIRLTEVMNRTNCVNVTRMMAASGYDFDEDLVQEIAYAGSLAISKKLDELNRA